MSSRKEILQNCLSDNISRIICKMSDESIYALEEIRIRTGRGVIFKGGKALCKAIPTEEDVRQCILRMSDYSVYARMEQLRQGFITLEGGHRVGITGRCVIHKDILENITDISSINIRMAHQFYDVSKDIHNEAMCGNMLIISPPGCGKTTMLRDLARFIGKTEKVSLIDERCEIAACVNGIPQLDVGMQTDVISNISKALAIPLLIRSMSPDVIMTDELSGNNDINSVTEACSMGVRVIATVHGKDLKDVKSRMNVDVFDKFVILDKNKKIAEVI